MTREEILCGVKRFFDKEELFCPHVLARFGERSWQFLDTNFLHVLLILRRDIIKLPLYCNSRTQHQRGLRCNMCELVKSKKQAYLSPHVLGKAGDFTCGVPTMTAEKMRALVKEKADLLPCKVRLESGVSWLHIDTIDMGPLYPKVYEFKA